MAPIKRGQLVAAPLEEGEGGALVYARARVDDFKEVTNGNHSVGMLFLPFDRQISHLFNCMKLFDF